MWNFLKKYLPYNHYHRLIAMVVMWTVLVGASGLMPSMASANQGSVLGIHIMNTSELGDVESLVGSADDGRSQWHYVTIPLTLADLEREDEWRQFFQSASDKRIVPIVRLTTTFEGGAWRVPTRKDVVDQIAFLSRLQWPTDERRIIIFNEVNHRKEWGGTIDPAGYAQVLRFAAEWAHSEQKNYIVLPAAMDLAAPTGAETHEALAYLEAMRLVDPDIFGVVDAWNSHSYANPGFVSSPERTAQNSLRGFHHELAYLKEKTGRDFSVYITETGWINNQQTSRWLSQYYRYAAEHIWSDPRVVAVTPFVLRGAPGPFSGFSFLDQAGQPTAQYIAFQQALKVLRD